MAKKITITEDELEELINIEVEISQLTTRLSRLRARAFELKGVIKAPPIPKEKKAKPLPQKPKKKKRKKKKRTLVRLSNGEKKFALLDGLLKGPATKTDLGRIRGLSNKSVEPLLEQMESKGYIKKAVFEKMTKSKNGSLYPLESNGWDITENGRKLHSQLAGLGAATSSRAKASRAAA